MAFELVHELPSGITGNYWKMSSALVSCNDAPMVLVYMDLYLSRDARNEGKTPITNEYFSFGLHEVDMSYSFDFRVCLYKTLKTLPRWQDAVDIFDDPNKQPVISNVSLATNIDTDGTVDLYSWDPFNEPITYSIVSQPSNGSISLNGKICTYTPNAGFYQAETFQGGVTTDYVTNNPSSTATLLGSFNSQRLPAYHRLDITFKKQVKFKNKTTMELIASVTNVYGRNNIFYVNRVTGEEIYQFPILPSFGLSYKF